MQTISEYQGVLVVVRCWCGIQHAVPESLRKLQLAERDAGREHVVWCPLGHKYTAAGESEVARLQREIARQQAAHDQTKAELRETEQRRRAEKAAKTRLKNRISKGVCPCCNRYFANVHRHVVSQHPEFQGTVNSEEA